MLTVVLDSSVLVSPFITPNGSVAQLLKSPLRQRYRLCLSEPILTELARILLHKTSIRRYADYSDADAHDYLRWLLGQAQMVGNLPDVRIVADDPDDDVILATALVARADFLVTGDRRHLLPIRVYSGIRIVSPKEFRAFLEG